MNILWSISKCRSQIYNGKVYERGSGECWKQEDLSTFFLDITTTPVFLWPISAYWDWKHHHRHHVYLFLFLSTSSSSESSGDSCVFVNRKPMKICSCRFPIGNNQRHISELKHGLVDLISVISEISKMSEISWNIRIVDCQVYSVQKEAGCRWT